MLSKRFLVIGCSLMVLFTSMAMAMEEQDNPQLLSKKKRKKLDDSNKGYILRTTTGDIYIKDNISEKKEEEHVKKQEWEISGDFNKTIPYKYESLALLNSSYTVKPLFPSDVKEIEILGYKIGYQDPEVRIFTHLNKVRTDIKEKLLEKGLLEKGLAPLFIKDEPETKFHSLSCVLDNDKLAEYLTILVEKKLIPLHVGIAILDRVKPHLSK
jgi:hypothetical protein